MRGWANAVWIRPFSRARPARAYNQKLSGGILRPAGGVLATFPLRRSLFKSVDLEECICGVLGGRLDFLWIDRFSGAEQLPFKQILQHKAFEVHRRQPGIRAP